MKKTRFFLVTDPAPDSTFGDTFVELDKYSLANVIRGTDPKMFHEENTEIYCNERDAISDARRRWKDKRGKLLPVKPSYNKITGRGPR